MSAPTGSSVRHVVRTMFDLVGPSMLLGLANLMLAVPSRHFRLFVATRVLGWRVGRDVWLGRRLRVLGFGGVTIGSRVVIHRRSEIDGRGGLSIGSDVAFAPGVTVLTADHDPDSPTRAYREQKVTIGDRVWLATGATVLPGCVIGDGVVLGAQAVASGRLDAWNIYFGNPATVRRPRDPAAQDRLAARLPRWL